MATLNNEAKKGIILSVFSNTDLDRLFIEVASDLGYSEYYTELQPLNDMSDDELNECYDRTVQVALGVNQLIS
jgi:hypothetical protein